MITFRQLRYLRALAHHRHFGRAAKECAISQPALSMQIQDLERELGAKLVERLPGEVHLTATGIEVAQRGNGILSAADDLVGFARHRGRILCGPLRLGIIPSLAPYLLPLILPPLQRRYPELKLELRETQTDILIGELLQGGLDAVLIASSIQPPQIKTMPLFSDAFFLAAPADQPFPKRARITANDIDMQRLILLEDGHCLRDQALAFCGAAGSLKELGATSLATVMQMVASGHGVTLIPAIAIDAETRDKRVQILRFAEPEPGRTIALAWRRTSSREKDCRALGELVIETMKAAGQNKIPKTRFARDAR